MGQYIYMDVENINKLHNNIIERSWWTHWILKEGEIEKIIIFMQNDEYYEFFYQKVAYLLYSIVMNHPFIDGNKRTALFSTAYFIYLNTNNKILTNAFIREYEDIVVFIAEWRFKKGLLQEYTENFINKYDIEESPLLEVYRMLSNNSLIE